MLTPEIAQVLKPRSEMLDLVDKTFHQILESRKEQRATISITCFYEELDVEMIGTVIWEFATSARLMSSRLCLNTPRSSRAIAVMVFTQTIW